VRSSAPFRYQRFPLTQVTAELLRTGVSVLPLLRESFRQELLEETRCYRFRQARAMIGKGASRVAQRMAVCADLRPDGVYHYLRACFQELFDAAVRQSRRQLFDGRVTFNDHMLQRYTVGELGISPHRDRTAYRHLICLFVIAGYGRFYVCSDRSGTGAREIVNGPGDAIIMRAPGFQGSGERPFHYLADIRSTRYVFGLRHDQTKFNGKPQPLCV
jgi:hypothetical protein